MWLSAVQCSAVRRSAAWATPFSVVTKLKSTSISKILLKITSRTSQAPLGAMGLPPVKTAEYGTYDSRAFASMGASV